MNLKLKQIIPVFLILSTLVFVSCEEGVSSELNESKTTQSSTEKIDLSSAESAEKSYYTCSMHPQIEEHEPGRCPICNMRLTKIVISDEDEDEVIPVKESTSDEKTVWVCKDFPEATSDKEDICPLDGTPMVVKGGNTESGKIIAKVKLRKAQVDHFFPEVFPVSKLKMTKKIRLLGTILQSEEKQSAIPARVNGRIEKVFIKSTGAFIKKGDPVIELYSPQLITAGEEYILAKKSYRKNKNKQMRDLLDQSRERLKLWGIKDLQLSQWVRNGRVPNSIKIYSEASGVVRKRNAIVGKYFKEGQNFFELSDLAAVWVEMDVYEHDSALVGIGQVVNLSFSALPKNKYLGPIDFISPVLDSKTRTLKVRTTIANSEGLLKPGMVADAVLTIQYEGLPLAVPRSAIIDTGKKKVVWKQITSKKFQAIQVETGLESEGYTEITSGLKGAQGCRRRLT